MSWTTHQQVRITAPPWMTVKTIRVDEEIAPLLRQLWRRCFVTVASCQDCGDGTAQVVFDSIDMAQGFASIAHGPAGWTHDPGDWKAWRTAWFEQGHGTSAWLEQQWELQQTDPQLAAARDAEMYRMLGTQPTWAVIHESNGWSFHRGGDPREPYREEPACSVYFPREILAKVKAAEDAGRGVRSYAQVRAAYEAAAAEVGVGA